VESLRHLVPQHRASLESAHTQARQQAEEFSRITATRAIA
jgi:FMN-dependent NADH-azoreductase